MIHGCLLMSFAEGRIIKIKDYQNLIAGILISLSIVIAAYIIAGAIETGCNYIGARIINLGDFIMSSFN